VEVGLIGPLQIRDGSSVIAPGGPRQRRLLARLGLDAGRRVSFDALEGAVWGDEPPPTARHTIAAQVSRLRRLGLSIPASGDGYRLDTATDIQALERLISEGRERLASEPRRAMSMLSDAVALWRDHPLPDLEHVPAAQVEAARLEELIEGLREDLLVTELDDGARNRGLVAKARGLTAEQPYRERRWELLMLALYRAGRQAEALDVYSECRRRLVDDLGIEPGPGLRRMQQAVLAQDPALDPPVAGGAITEEHSRLPGSSTRLIGRTREQEALGEVWTRARVVTLMGPPGAGKTRLAVEAARHMSMPVWYVALSQLSLERTVAAAVLDVVAPTSLATDARQGMIETLVDATGLLVLDECDLRLADVTAEINALVTACPGVRVLATSRERLGVFDESLIPVGPLAESEALELLVDRARLVDPHFELRADELATADRLCGLVDRLPLGLELVARHLNLLRIDELTERVEVDLSRWAGGPTRGRTGLWAALDASVARLGLLERRVMVALAVMIGDADAGLIAEVIDPADPHLDVFEAIARLVDASLVQVRSAEGPTRYELLRTIAIHTLETGDDDLVAAARGHYRDAVLVRAAALASRLATADRPVALQRLDREMPHILAVLARCAASIEPGPATRALEVAVAMTEYWLGRRPAEGLEWLRRLESAAPQLSALRAQAALSGAHLAYWLTDFAVGREMGAEARAGFAAIGDPLGEGRALRRLGAIAAATDDLDAAREFLEASLGRLGDTGAEREVGATLLHLGSLLADQGRRDEAQPLLQRALAIAVSSGDPLARGHALAALTLAYWKGGDLGAAMEAGDEALILFRQLGHRPTEGTVSYRLAAVARGLGRPRAARRYALQAIAAGELARTRTTVAFGHINLARLDLDAGAIPEAAAHLGEALLALDPVADRWVLADGLEAAARLAVVSDTAGAGALLDAARAIREAIHQPVAPTELADVEATGAGQAAPGEHRGAPVAVAGRTAAVGGTADSTAAALTAAIAIARDLARPSQAPTPLRRARS
jgi:predicted ATPase/DNA-binding SARP family transcriptional activator